MHPAGWWLDCRDPTGRRRTSRIHARAVGSREEQFEGILVSHGNHNDDLSPACVPREIDFQVIIAVYRHREHEPRIPAGSLAPDAVLPPHPKTAHAIAIQVGARQYVDPLALRKIAFGRLAWGRQRYDRFRSGILAAACPQDPEPHAKSDENSDRQQAHAVTATIDRLPGKNSPGDKRRKGGQRGAAAAARLWSPAGVAWLAQAAARGEDDDFSAVALPRTAASFCLTTFSRSLPSA